MSVQLRSTGSKPADYDGAAANVAVSPSAAGSKAEEPAPAFATIKLKKVQRPADYDGKEPNVAFKKTEDTPNNPYAEAKLKHVAQQ